MIINDLKQNAKEYKMPSELKITAVVFLVLLSGYTILLFVKGIYLLSALYSIILIISIVGFFYVKKITLMNKKSGLLLFTCWIVTIVFFNAYPMAKIYLARSAAHSKNADNIIERWIRSGVPVSLLAGEGRTVNAGHPFNQFENWSLKYKIRSIGGYGSFFPGTTFNRFKNDDLITRPFVADTIFKNNNNLNSKTLAKYGVEYLIADREVKYDFRKNGWELVYPTEGYDNHERIFKNENYVGRAYIIDSEKKIDRGAKIEVDKDDYVKISVEAKEGEKLILSDSWYPGWQCYDNGKKKEGFDADGFRGYKINDAGHHYIEWIYQPLSFISGLAISIISILFYVIITIRKVFRK
jgi:hypothetical protein